MSNFTDLINSSQQTALKIAYMARSFVQATLPHRVTAADFPVWIRVMAIFNFLFDQAVMLKTIKV